jgi:hypothetical protein
MYTCLVADLEGGARLEGNYQRRGGKEIMRKKEKHLRIGTRARRNVVQR